MSITPLTPNNVQVTLERRPLSADELRGLRTLEVRESSDRTTSLTLSFDGRDELLRGPLHLDDARFQVGAAIEVSLGVPPVSVMIGDITRTRVDLGADGGAGLTLEGYGLRHRLGRAPESRPWEHETDSGIAARLARKHGLVPRGEATTTIHPRLEQFEQTDLEFLLARAAAIDFDLWVDGEELWFSRLEQRRANALTLTPAELLTLEASVDGGELLDTVRARWVDPDGRDQFVSVDARELGDALAGRLRQRWGSRTVTLDGVSASSDAARKLAVAHMRQAIEQHFSISASCRGRPELRVGTRVTLRGLGGALDGELVVVEATHSVSSAEHRTTFTGRRPS